MFFQLNTHTFLHLTVLSEISQMVQSSTAERNKWAELTFDPSPWSLPEGTFPETVYGTPSSPASHVPHCTWDPTPESGCSSRSGGGVECPLLSPLRLSTQCQTASRTRTLQRLTLQHLILDTAVLPKSKPPGGEISCLSNVFGLELFMKERKGGE